MTEPEISRPLASGELEEMTKDETKFFVIGMLHPGRIGFALFSTLLEYRHYPPDTLKNDLFQLVVLKWEEIYWGVISIPIWDKVFADRIAKETGLKFADGIPSMIGGEGVKTFPVTDSERIVTIEYISGHIGYTNDKKAISNLMLQENLLINEVYKGNLGPFEFKVLKEGG